MNSPQFHGVFTLNKSILIFKISIFWKFLTKRIVTVFLLFSLRKFHPVYARILWQGSNLTPFLVFRFTYILDFIFLLPFITFIRMTIRATERNVFLLLIGLWLNFVELHESWHSMFHSICENIYWRWFFECNIESKFQYKVSIPKVMLFFIFSTVFALQIKRLLEGNLFLKDLEKWILVSLTW